jgi:3-oxoacyl-[acyl-carrier protein] reductase
MEVVPAAHPGPQRVLVCGASGAIGGAVAAAFAAAGADLCLHYRSRREPAETLAAELTGRGRARVHVAGADLTDATATAGLVAAATRELGGLEVVVASVGDAQDKPVFLLTEADLAGTLEANLTPVVNLVEAFRAGRAGRPGGRVVLVASITGLVGQPMRAAYAAAKGAVIAYAKSVAREVARTEMTVNCIAPQVADGGLAERMRPGVRRLLLENTPVGRACAPSEVAAAAVYLASPGAAYLTGTVLNLTGGLVTW